MSDEQAETIGRLRVRVQAWEAEANDGAAEAGDRSNMVSYHYRSGRGSAFRTVLELLQQMAAAAEDDR